MRAVLRIARRDAARHKGRSAMVAILVALPVLFISAFAVVVRSSELTPADRVRIQLGTGGQAALDAVQPGTRILQSPDAGSWLGDDGSGNGSVATPVPTGEDVSAERLTPQVAALVPARDRLVTDVSAPPPPGGLRLGDRALDAMLRELDDVRALAGSVDVVQGRAPGAAGEVLVSRSLADRSGLTPGSTLSLRPDPKGAPQQLTVVGIADSLDLKNADQVIGLPGTLLAGLPDPQVRWRVVGPDPVPWSAVLALNDLGVLVLSRDVVANPPPPDRVPYLARGAGSEGVPADAVAFLVAAVGLLLLQVALLAGPAVAVGARRSQRSLALLAAGGAERRHLRAVVLAGSGVAGLVGSVVAAGLGVLLGWALIAALTRWTDDVVPGVRVSVLDLAVLVLVGTLTAVAAAVLPARQAARLDVLATLTGRRGSAPPQLAVPVIGFILAGSGAALCAVGAVRQFAVAVVIGVAAMQIGLIMASGGIVAVAARLGRRLPLALRLAVRDAARHRSRTAPAIAAVLAAIAGGVTATVYLVGSQDAEGREYAAFAAPGTVGVNTQEPVALAAAGPDAAQRDALRGQARELRAVVSREAPVGAAVPVHTVSWDVSVAAVPNPSAPCLVPQVWPLPEDQADQLATDPACRATRLPGEVGRDTRALVDDGSALAVLTGADDRTVRAALRAGRVVVYDPDHLWPDGTVHLLVDPQVRPGADGQPVTDEAPGRTVVLPGTLARAEHPVATPVLPPAVARQLQLPMIVESLVLPSPGMSVEQEERAVAAAADAGFLGLEVERGYRGDLAGPLLAFVLGAVAIALVGTLTAAGLAAAEGRADTATLAAVGASPGLRRRLAAAQAAVISVLGGAAGLLSGLVTGVALLRLNASLTEGIDGGTEFSWLSGAWPYLLALALGPPLVTVLARFAVTRSRLPLVRRLGA